MEPKTEKATDLIADIVAFLEGIGQDVTSAEVEASIRYAEHRMWMEQAQVKIDAEKAILAARQRDFAFMTEFHAARLEAERQRQNAALAEAHYWTQRALLLALGHGEK